MNSTLNNLEGINMKCLKRTTLLIALCSASTDVYGAHPFDDCPTEAMLFQGSPSTVYEVDLSSGAYRVANDQNTGATGVINAVGFNETDRYIYGWNKGDSTVTRINQLYLIENVSVTGLPADTNFFVGDVFDDALYFYLRGTGMYKIDLSTGDDNFIAVEIMTAAEATLNLTDFAFYPETGELFAVENSANDLYKFSFDGSGNASFAVVGSTGLTGSTTFGAQYFDVNGFMYISNNVDGNIYRIDLRDITGTIDATAEFFASGPLSGQNDGARCASAPVIATNTDFGDAPESYKTSILTNGPRHFIGPNFFFGSLIDDEGDSAVLSGSSDDATSSDDEDGIVFINDLKQGSDTRIQVTIGGGANTYVSAWFDWNDDGDFADEGEQAITDQLLPPGVNILKLRVPETATPATTWARFRGARNTGITYFGGVTDGEVEDYSVTINEQNLTHNYYPGEGTWVTLAYEDNWPEKDDFDFNDVVMFYRVDTVTDTNTGNIVRYDISGSLQAYGADFINGFAVQLDGIARSSIDEDLTKLVVNNQTKHEATVLEAGTTNAVAVISTNLKAEITDPVCSGSEGNYYRVWQGCSSDSANQFVFEASIPFSTPLAAGTGPSMPLNPFICGLEGRYHGDSFGGNPGRSLEIHLKGDDITSVASSSFFSTNDDTSTYTNCPGEDCDTYHTDNGISFGLLIDGEWNHPSERTDILAAYPDLEGYATSGGATNTDWYLRSNAVINQLFE